MFYEFFKIYALKKFYLILFFALFILSICFSYAFDAEGDTYSIGSYNMGMAGVESEGTIYSARSTLEEGQPSDSSAESASFLSNLGWFKELIISEETEETTTPTTVTPGGGGSSSMQIQFDVDIIDFDSPAKLGDFFNFIYFVKGVGNINHDIVVDYWIEKGGEVVTFSSSMFYMGTNEEMVKDGLLFLPEDISSGVYTLVVQANYGDVRGEAHKAIELIVSDMEVEIKELFDIMMYLEDVILESSDDLNVVITFENFGNVLTEVGLIYSIIDEEGRNIFSEKGSVIVEVEEFLRKGFVGLDLPDGEYTFVLETFYGEGIYDKFEADFQIVSFCSLLIFDFGKFVFCWYWWVLIFVGLFLMILIFILKFGKGGSKKKRGSAK